MAGPTARPVKQHEIQRAKLLLEQSVKRMEEVLTIMTDNRIDHIDLRRHVTMTVGVKSIGGMTSEMKLKADDAAIAAQMGLPTSVEQNRAHHAKYSKKAVKKTTPNK